MSAVFFNLLYLCRILMLWGVEYSHITFLFSFDTLPFLGVVFLVLALRVIINASIYNSLIHTNSNLI